MFWSLSLLSQDSNTLAREGTPIFLKLPVALTLVVQIFPNQSRLPYRMGTAMCVPQGLHMTRSFCEDPVLKSSWVTWLNLCRSLPDVLSWCSYSSLCLDLPPEPGHLALLRLPGLASVHHSSDWLFLAPASFPPSVSRYSLDTIILRLSWRPQINGPHAYPPGEGGQLFCSFPPCGRNGCWNGWMG